MEELTISVKSRKTQKRICAEAKRIARLTKREMSSPQPVHLTSDRYDPATTKGGAVTVSVASAKNAAASDGVAMTVKAI